MFSLALTADNSRDLDSEASTIFRSISLFYLFTTSVRPFNPGEPVLSQRRDLLEQPLDSYELDDLPATQPTVSKQYRKTQWSLRNCVQKSHIINQLPSQSSN